MGKNKFGKAQLELLGWLPKKVNLKTPEKKEEKPNEDSHA
jgi:hypothetical protein